MSRLRILAGAVLVAGILSCGSPRALETRLWSDSFAVRITSDPVPPRAVEDVVFKVVVQDKKTGEFIQNGEGRVYGTSRDRANVNDGLAPAKELGTYYAHILFPTTGDWAMGIQVRRNPQSRLETLTWIQTVNNPTGPGS
ncbi:MAG TPA: hypothetical protein VNC11_09835 [Gemmatimonadaceae bacterium]|nr:hypothetical protein [Gemmatimonadaceae bacterium]